MTLALRAILHVESDACCDDLHGVTEYTVNTSRLNTQHSHNAGTLSLHVSVVHLGHEHFPSGEENVYA